MESIYVNQQYQSEVPNEVLTSKEKRQSYKRVSELRLGETIFQNCGELAFIVEYNNYHDIMVQFHKTKELVKTTYGNFINSNVKSHFTPSVYGVGIVGLELTHDKNNKPIDSYSCWRMMLRRCYDKKYHQIQPTYIGCEVTPEWLYYSNFKKWYYKNYYQIEELSRTELDKDILVKGNKIYSPDTCVFVPVRINSLFTKSNKNRGNYPIGVYFNKIVNKYQATCSIIDKNTGKQINKHLGLHDLPEQAFEAYKTYKESYIKEIANEYKEKIPANLYLSMMNYQVDIND